MKPALTAALLLCACASPKSAGGGPAAARAEAGGSQGKTLFERLGGRPAIEAVIDDLLARVSRDERINAPFAGAHLPRLRQRLVEQVCQASGGPCVYSGRDMKTVHAGMGITGEQFDALVGHLVATLDRFGVPEQEKGELLAVLGPLRGDVVEEP